MVASVRVARLRDDLATFRQRVPRGTYPSALRERAVAYAAELGVREATASRWAGAAAPAPPPAAVGSPALSLIPLVVGGQRLDTGRPRLRIELPDWTRIHASGLAVSEVVETIQALRSSR